MLDSSRKTFAHRNRSACFYEKFPHGNLDFN